MDVYSYQCREGVNQYTLFGTLAPTGKSSMFSVRSFSKLFRNFLRCTCTFLLHHSQAEQQKKNNNRIPRSTSASPNITPMYDLWKLAKIGDLYGTQSLKRHCKGFLRSESPIGNFTDHDILQIWNVKLNLPTLLVVQSAASHVNANVIFKGLSPYVGLMF